MQQHTHTHTRRRQDMTRLRSRPQQQSQQCCRCCEQTMPSTAFLKLSISACRSFEPVPLVHGFRANKIDAIPYINTFNRSRTDLTREWHCRTDKNCTHASRGRRMAREARMTATRSSGKRLRHDHNHLSPAPSIITIVIINSTTPPPSALLLSESSESSRLQEPPQQEGCIGLAVQVVEMVALHLEHLRRVPASFRV